MPVSLAHVHRVTTTFAGAPRELFVFDHHRSAFTIWASAAQQRGALTLVTLDRHMDLEAPGAPPPALPCPLEALDAYARDELAARNDDHVVASMEAGAIGDAVIVARSHEPKSLQAFAPYRDAAGRAHRCAFARSLDAAGDDAYALIAAAPAIALDVDLDCFTTLSDADPDEVVPWDAELIESFLLPPGAERFWGPVLRKAAVVTLAREPYHCGGLTRGARLWEAFAEVFFRRVLGVPPP